MATNPFRNLPSVTELLESPQFKAVRDRVNHSVVAAKVRSYLDDLRSQVQTTATEVVWPTVSDLAQRWAQRILQAEQSRLRPVINATGVLLPAGLGGAPLAESAIEEMVSVARDYASLELDLDTGQSAVRSQCLESLLKELTGAEAALVVNSGTAATLLALAALASGREVVVARSELLETAEGLRLSDAIAASGARLHEVGAANSSRIDDYRQAIGPHTGLLLLVAGGEVPAGAGHTPLPELVQLGQAQGLGVVHDLGPAALIDLRPFGIEGVPVMGDSIRAGADLVLAGGERMGGPQCGLVAGKRPLVEQIARHPLMHAVQADRTTLAALAATLRLYRQSELARESVPLLQLWTTSVDNLHNRAQRLAPQLAACGSIAGAEAVAGTARLSASGQPGGPGGQLPSWQIELTPAAGWSLERVAAALRSGRPAVLGHIERERLVLNLRTVFPRQDQQLVEAVAAITKDKSE
jgi:L-seryl-tRNA(Ser) seleniumtransferase